jgi:hypothetical protein
MDVAFEAPLTSAADRPHSLDGSEYALAALVNAHPVDALRL